MFSFLQEWWRRRTSPQDNDRKRTAPRELRLDLQAEQREIADELERTFTVYQERLHSLARRLQGADERTIQAEVGLIRETQAALRQVIARVEVADRETRSLLDEWEDWERFDQGKSPSDKHIRQELLRSELALRGVRMQRPESAPSSPDKGSRQQAEGLPPTIGAADHEHVVKAEQISSTGLIEAWEETMTNLLPVTLEAWEREGQAAHAGEVSDKHAASILHQIKETHAAQRSFDRQSGKRRHRMHLH